MTESAEIGHAERGWVTHFLPCPDGVDRPFLVKRPPNFDPGRSYPLLFSLHGGVMRPGLEVDSRPAKLDPIWGWGVDEGLYILVVPVTNRLAPWWSDAGAEWILSVLGAVRKMVNVDERRVFCMGFSDGASGAFYMALHHPTPFAGFICINGGLSAASSGGHAIYPGNLRARPLYVMNSGRDRTFAPDWVRRDIRAMELAGLRCFEQQRAISSMGDEAEPDDGFFRHSGPKLCFHMWTDSTHSPALFLTAERSSLREFLTKTTRDPYPNEIYWETESPARGRCDWLEVDGIGRNSRRPSKRMEFADVANSAVVIQPRDWKPGGRVHARRRNNAFHVETDGVSSYSIHLSPEMVDYRKPVEIYTNGQLSFTSSPAPEVSIRERAPGACGDSPFYDSKLSMTIPVESEHGQTLNRGASRKQIPIS